MKTHSHPWVDKSKRADCLILFLPFVSGLQAGKVDLNLSTYTALARRTANTQAGLDLPVL